MRPDLKAREDPLVCETCGRQATRKLIVKGGAIHGACETHKDALSREMARHIDETNKIAKKTWVSLPRARKEHPSWNVRNSSSNRRIA